LIRCIILFKKKKKKGPLRGLIENTFILIDCFTSSVEFEGRILYEKVEDQHTAVYMFELTEDENNKTLTTYRLSAGNHVEPFKEVTILNNIFKL